MAPFTRDLIALGISIPVGLIGGWVFSRKQPDTSRSWPIKIYLAIFRFFPLAGLHDYDRNRMNYPRREQFLAGFFICFFICFTVAVFILPGSSSYKGGQ